MDERKRERTFESSSEPKRFRPEEILGEQNGDKIITRLLVNRIEFSRLIGKGGQTISLIRNTTGANIKGVDIDEDTRLVLVTGYFNEVIKAFDLISDLLQHAQTSQLSQSGGAMEPSDHPREVSHGTLNVHLLLEHSKAGKVIGTRGSMMQIIKGKSLVHSLKMEKEPKEYSGVPLRKLSVEGSLSSVRRAHFHLLEVFYNGTSAALMGLSAMGGGGGGGITSIHNQQQSLQPYYSSTTDMGVVAAAAAAAAAQHGFALSAAAVAAGGGSGSSNGGAPSASLAATLGGSAIPLAPLLQQRHLLGAGAASSLAAVPAAVFLPFSALTESGVQAETVQQLVDMKAYLLKHFNVNLCCTMSGPHDVLTSGLPRTSMSGAQRQRTLSGGGIGGESTMDVMLAQRRQQAEAKTQQAVTSGILLKEQCFAIPRSCVGGLIAKGAQGIKDLQEEFAGLRIYVEKDDYDGKRIVVLSFTQSAVATEGGSEIKSLSEVEGLMERCQNKICSLVEDLLQQQQQQQQSKTEL